MIGSHFSIKLFIANRHLQVGLRERSKQSLDNYKVRFCTLCMAVCIESCCKLMAQFNKSHNLSIACYVGQHICATDAQFL